MELLLYSLALCAATFLIFRAFVERMFERLTDALREIRKGNDEVELPIVFTSSGLVHEVKRLIQQLRQARLAARREARLRLEKFDTPWTAERLKEFIRAHLRDRPIFVLSNREPYVHDIVHGRIEWGMPAGGVVTALEPVMEACGGMWIAHGSGKGDRATADENGEIRLPPDEPKYTLKRVWLTEEEVQGYYTGFSNEALWPLCLMAHTRPIFREEDWSMYKKVNAKFATTLLAEVHEVERPVVLIQDYHLALAPAMIKRARPDALVALFWHIPWPPSGQFTICPWREELLEGILGADLVGFQTQMHCNSFIDTVNNETESRIDYDRSTVTRGEHETFIKPFPISIAFPGSAEPRGEPDRSLLEALKLNGQRIILGVDRLDYAKGILERFKGLEYLLEEFPAYRGTVTLLQIASPTRESVEKYREYGKAVSEEAARINEKFATPSWRPILLEKQNYSHTALGHLYRLVDVCLITSLHDGMNLVAKEFVAARSDNEGVLVLSEFAGAASDLKGALIINPYSASSIAAALDEALRMQKSDQHRAMKSMREAVQEYNIYRWSSELVRALARLE